jgi:hypothetical protein
MKRKNGSSNDSDNSTTIIIVVIICCCCVIFSIISGIVAYFLLFKKGRQQGKDKSILEYIDTTGNHTITSLPFDIKNAYYINLPPGSKKYKFTGKKCFQEVCEDVVLKNVQATNLFYDDSDGNLLSGKLEYTS